LYGEKSQAPDFAPKAWRITGEILHPDASGVGAAARAGSD